MVTKLEGYIPIAAPMIGDEEIDAAVRVLRSGTLAQGPEVRKFEKSFAEFCEVEHAVMLNSGTATLHAALHASNVGPGDEVLTTPFTFIGTVNPILAQGAVPKFVDINPDDFNINPDLVESAITSRTKAIIGVDLFGQPYDYIDLRDIAKRHNVMLIEDSCQAIGAKFREKSTGTLGDIGAFSLYATKNITCGEGGILTTNDNLVAEETRRFRQHGMSGPYEYEGHGYNYRSTDLAAAIASAQLRRVEEFNSHRQYNARILDQELSSIPGIIRPSVSPDRSHVYHQYTIRVTPDFPLTRDELRRVLKEHNIGSGVYYPQPLHLVNHINLGHFSVGDFPEAERASREVLSLPIHPMVTSGQLVHISSVIQSVATIRRSE